MKDSASVDLDSWVDDFARSIPEYLLSLASTNTWMQPINPKEFVRGVARCSRA
jgi:hypothetical protein